MTRTKANGFDGADDDEATTAAAIKSSNRWRVIAINSVAAIVAVAADCVAGGGSVSFGSTTMRKRQYEGGQKAA